MQRMSVIKMMTRSYRKLLARVRPQGLNAVNVLVDDVGVRAPRRTNANVHGEMLADPAKAAVHLGGDAARDGAGMAVLRPEARGRVLLGNVLEDRERLPHLDVAVDEQREPAAAEHRVSWPACLEAGRTWTGRCWHAWQHRGRPGSTCAR